MDNCLFCRIIGGEIPSERVYEDDTCIAIRDIDPQAPTHLLIMPKRHVASVSQLTDAEMAGRLLLAARDIAARLGIESYRLVVNTGADAGQSVPHLHIHLMAGRPVAWPAG